MASFNQSGGNDPNNQLQSLLGRLQASRNPNDDSADAAAHELLSRYSSSYNNSQGNPNDVYYRPHGDGDSPPVMASHDAFMPPAPTPPVSNFSHSHHGSGLMNLGPIGGPVGARQKPDQSANLLNLLKFSGAGGSGGGSGGHTESGSQSSPTNLVSASSLDASLALSHNTTIDPPLIHAPVPMPADPQGLLATLMKGNASNDGQRGEGQNPPAGSSWSTAAPSADTQAYLLNLLNRPKPSQNDQPSAQESTSTQDTTLTPQSAHDTNSGDHTRDYADNLKQNLAGKVSQDDTPLAYPYNAQQQQQQHQPPHVDSPPANVVYASPSLSHTSATRKFDHHNPFDDATSKSPHNRTPKSTASGTAAPPLGTASHPAEAPSFHIMKKKGPSASSSPGSHFEPRRVSTHRSPVISPEHVNSRMDQSFTAHHGTPERHEHHRETVSEAMNDLAVQADKEAQEALARADREETQAKIAGELEAMLDARSESEFRESAKVAALDIKHELEKENSTVLEDSLAPEVAKAVREIVDETAQGQVADSWESAEADEIVVIEEESTPVKVYNFPMRPWISITLQENEEFRPSFREDVILDIARLKKDFDQIDRNLVSATETYMVYGMSKAGGLRVIRQDDGRDVKLFTDTKDRIFNIAVSSTGSDSGAIPKEAIIGTGISGSVYYVQIKNGEKDHLVDPHPEQYGFCLPPVNQQEGDSPGGVLKTRARTSSTHPDYFAVGRGKTINIIWPAYVMQNNLFKAGHDRVVDTEQLSKQLSLRINTGKAGKDFTFSQDDTTIVSLDKSGRVKFWDVRDLTAVNENSDPRYPMPAQTSLEVKEPLMTLNTTPEGEKAWPTSVFLLDKQRPYQKRCALRYMIVGMKQNHTLQLWDLALGKPVQEFNLPHSKESDAVCSVMYHPPTGMIVVGHPTRNSIYFLHLSAPKYTIKGLSQVDYIQKLVAKDSSIPEPDSTAVISGVREYSFSNKGVIRSLDILVNPTLGEDEEPTLFELYAMHSKGVTGIFVKQTELGWTSDNKVIAPVDAVEAGIVKITKLKELPNAQPTESHIAEDPASTTLPVRLASRSAQKETPSSHGAAAQDGSREVQNSTTPPAVKLEGEKGEIPFTPVHQAEKAEKKTRKKRDKTAAANAGEKISAEAQNSAGSAHSPLVGPSSGKHHHEPKNAISLGPTVTSETAQSLAKSITADIVSSVSDTLNKTLVDHRKQVNDELRTRDNTFKTSQQDLLKIVSSVLNDNTQTVLTRIISDQFEGTVLPSLSEAVGQAIAKAVPEHLDNKLNGRIVNTVQNQMQRILPNAVAQALQKPDLTKAVSERLVQGMSDHVQDRFLDVLNNNITPAFTEMAISTAQRIGNDVRRQTAEQIEQLEQRHHADSVKIDQLTALVTRLSDTVSAMAATQAQFQDGFLKLQQQTVRDRQPVHPPSASSQGENFARQSQVEPYGSPSANSNNQLMPFPNSNSSKEAELQQLIASIRTIVDRGDMDTALIRWLQSDRQEEVFKEYLVKLNPNFLQDLAPLISLSAGATISQDLDGPLIREKVSWMEMIILGLHSSLPHVDAQVREVMPSIMSSYISRLEHLIMRISNVAPSDSILKHLTQMTSMAKRIIDVARNGY